MRVKVKLFAALSRFRPDAPAGTPFFVELRDPATLRDLMERLDLPPDEVKVAFVNGRARPLSWALADGDEVGIFPPVGGG